MKRPPRGIPSSRKFSIPRPFALTTMPFWTGNIRRSLWTAALAAVCLCAAPPDKEVLMVVPHTHWEGAVFKTREEYLEIGLPHILQALNLLKRYPDYRFVLDQMCYVKPFLDRYPTEAAAFREMLQNGRLEIAGGTDTMHDNNVPSGESIARH